MLAQRIFWLATGVVSTGCGIAGIVLPLVPTTPFLLLAAFAFARSSPRLHDWLVTHPRLGPPIDDWHRHGAISRRAKWIAVLVMAGSVAFTASLGFSGAVIAIQGAVLCSVALFILTRPAAPGP